MQNLKRRKLELEVRLLRNLERILIAWLEFMMRNHKWFDVVLEWLDDKVTWVDKKNVQFWSKMGSKTAHYAEKVKLWRRQLEQELKDLTGDDW